MVYCSAALCLMALALVSGQKLFGFSNLAWLILAGLALGLQLMCHSAVNWALKHLSASFIAAAILGEPVGSAILAWLFLGEKFAFLQMCGFAALLMGIFLAAKAEDAKRG
jgi:drug/metabolite transporter (DMT)-like permease